MLLKTHPDYKIITYYFDNQELILNTALVNQIEKILSKINIQITSINDVKDSNCFDIVLSSSYKGFQTDGILIKYNDGYQWSAFERWTNGKGYFSIKKSMAKTMNFIDLKIDCSFADVEIIVPKTIAIQVDGTTSFGAFEDKTSQTVSDGPLLKITGRVSFGGVEIMN